MKRSSVEYEEMRVLVRTGDRPFGTAAAGADVSVQLQGADGAWSDAAPIAERRRARDAFARASRLEASIRTVKPRGALRRLRLRQEGDGASRGWLVDDVVVTRHDSSEHWFPLALAAARGSEARSIWSAADGGVVAAEAAATAPHKWRVQVPRRPRLYRPRLHDDTAARP